MKPPTFDELSTFIIALAIIIGSFYGLLGTHANPELLVVYGSLLGAVATFFFQSHATRAATKNTIDAQNNGLDAIRQTVGRIEDGRAPTTEDIVKRQGHP